MLPKNLDSEGLKNMLVFAKDCVYSELLANTFSDGGFRTGIVHFRTWDAAEEARVMLDGKVNASGDANLQVEIVQRTPGGSVIPGSGRSAGRAGPSRQSTKFNGPFSNVAEKSPPRRPSYANGDAPDSAHYGNGMFHPQSPLGQPLERQRLSGKSVIGEDGVDEETGKLLNDPIAYANHDMGAVAAGMRPQPRRPTLGQLQPAGMNGPTINPGLGSPSMSALTSSRAQSFQSPTGLFPPGLNGVGSSNGYSVSSHQHPRAQMPPVNPADQNPPCNTLYVGNLPIDTSEDELKCLFHKQRGYKKLCFRTKSTGPMCFVEFEDTSYATKALKVLYGAMLSNSVKGGIRLSFSKNPLGVRREQNGMSSPLSPQGPMSGMNGYGSSQPFASANGPPPGLSAPPGLMSPIGSMYNGHGPFGPNGNGPNGNMGSMSANPMNPNGASTMSLQTPTVPPNNASWNGHTGNYSGYLYGR